MGVGEGWIHPSPLFLTLPLKFCIFQAKFRLFVPTLILVI